MIRINQQTEDIHKLKRIVRMLATCLMILARHSMSDNPDKISDMIERLQHAIDQLDEMM